MKLLCSILSLSFISTGMSQIVCPPSNIMVKQKQTGALVRGKPKFEVTLFNACRCPVGYVKLNCNGFQTVEKIDPTVLVLNGEECVLPHESFIAPFSGYVFSYAWDSEFQFIPNGATCLASG